MRCKTRARPNSQSEPWRYCNSRASGSRAATTIVASCSSLSRLRRICTFGWEWATGRGWGAPRRPSLTGLDGFRRETGAERRRGEERKMTSAPHRHLLELLLVDPHQGNIRAMFGDRTNRKPAFEQATAPHVGRHRSDPFPGRPERLLVMQGPTL